MKKLVKLATTSKVLMAVLIVLIAGMVAITMFFLGDKYAVESLSVERVTPTQIANAMKGDYFYSNYRENTLLIQGTVLSTSKNGGDLVVTFKTSSSYKAVCDFGKSSAVIHPGDTIIALSEGASALRQPSAVLLKNCIIP